jgi:diguanylate cyclase (GGDEF)-like protein
MSYFKEFQDLEEQGIDLIEILGQDGPLESPEALGRILAQLNRPGENLYAELLYYLTYRRLSPEHAENVWRAVMKHKRRMSELLERSVTFRVAALDYLTTRNPLLKQARILGRSEFESLFSYVNVDEVTGVFNRRYFNEVLAHEIQRSRRYGLPVSLLILDIDDFKRVNDSLGHIEGDVALRRIGRLLRATSRQSDTVCRFGGDEFALVLPQTAHAAARNMAERIRTAVRDLPMSDPFDGPLTVSVGGATYPDDCDEMEELVALADQMCLDAKRAGKDRVVLNERVDDLPLAAGP